MPAIGYVNGPRTADRDARLSRAGVGHIFGVVAIPSATAATSIVRRASDWQHIGRSIAIARAG